MFGQKIIHICCLVLLSQSVNTLTLALGKMTALTVQNSEWIHSVYRNKLRDLLAVGNAGNIIYCQFGNFNSTKTDSILKLIEAAIIEGGDKRLTMKRFSSLLIEVLQNISLHGAHDKFGQMHAYIILSKTKSHYQLHTGNLILETDIRPLNDRLNELNGHDKNTLRKMYIETLCNDEFSYKGGAGLGLLTIAKKSEDKLRYNIQQLNENLGYFQLESSLTID